MRKFLAQLSISVLGTILALILIAGILVLSLSGKSEKEIDNESILKLRFDDEMPEHTNNISIQGFSAKIASGPGLFETIDLLAKAGEDSRIKAIYLDLKDVSLSQAKVLMLIDAIQHFKASGKPVYAYGENLNQHAYLLASAADSIFVNPLGTVDIKGYGYAAPFYTQLMQKFGLHYEIYFAGEYKGATEPFRLMEFSEENSFQWKTYLQNLHDILVEEIAENRKINKTDVEQYINEGNTLNPNSSLRIGLIDGLLYRDQMEILLKQSLKLSELRMIDLAKYHAQRTNKSSGAADKIAIVFLEGEILSSASEYGVIDLKKYSEIFQNIKDDQSIKALVLRINSPGGDGQVSDILAHQIKSISDGGIPVICSMGTYAASGGYYLAANADYIVAENSSLTGSIGVFVMFPQIEEFLENKANIFFDTLQTSAYANGYSPFYNLTEGQKNRFRQHTDDLYLRFKQVVANGRNMSIEEVEKLARGRIWTAADAYTHNLIDTIANYKFVIDKAKEMAGLDEYELSEYPKIKKALWEEILMQIARQQSTVQTAEQTKSSVIMDFLDEVHSIQKINVKASIPGFKIN